jgi:uncharacterized protein YoxC
VVRGQDGKGIEQGFVDLKTIDEVKTRVPARPEWLVDHPNILPNHAGGVDTPAFRAAFARILVDPMKAGDEYYFEQIDGREVMTYLRPLPNFQRCYLCHGSDHKLRGVLMISSATDRMWTEVSDNRKQLLWGAFGTITVVGLLLRVSLNRGVFTPLHRVVERIKDVSGEADLTSRLDLSSQDEIGALAGGFNRFVEKLELIIREVSGISRAVAAAGRELARDASVIQTGVGKQTTGVDSTLQSMTDLHDAIKELGQGMEGLSKMIEESTAATMEMASSTDEIARDADSLSGSASETKRSVTTLAESIREIEGALDVVASHRNGGVRPVDRTVHHQIRPTLRDRRAVNRVGEHARSGQECVGQTIEGITASRSFPTRSRRWFAACSGARKTSERSLWSSTRSLSKRTSWR